MPLGMGAPPQQMTQQQQAQKLGNGNIGQLLSPEECARLVRYVISISQFHAHEMLLIGGVTNKNAVLIFKIIRRECLTVHWIAVSKALVCRKALP
jgi:hypothetical protein